MYRFFRNLAETDKKLGIFEIENHKIDFFFNFFITKFSNFISNMNDDCSQLSFEVYNVCVAQKLQKQNKIPFPIRVKEKSQ